MAFINEVAEQAERLKSFCREKDALAGLSGLDKSVFDQVVFTGMGSSYAAGYLASMRLASFGVRSFCMEPDILQRSYPRLIDAKTLVVAISQSGNSPETVQFARSVSPAQLIAIINNEDGELGKLTPYRVVLHAGPEEHTASKTYTNSIAAAYRVAEWFADSTDSVLDDVESLCDLMQELIDDASVLGNKMAGFFAEAKEIITIGAGTSFASVFQADYVLAEMDQVFTKYITPAEFFHGMIESANGSYNVILCDGDPDYSDRIDDVLKVLRERGSKCLVFSGRSDIPCDDRTMVLPLKITDAYLFPIADIVLIECLGYELALKRGLSPGELSYVHK